MPVDLFFPVPLLVHDVDPAVRDAVHAKVSAYLRTASAGRTIAPSPEESVTTSYYRPEASILVDADLKELEEAVVEAAKTFLEQTLELPPRHLEIERAWINLFEPGAQEAQHTHDGSLLSCSYYVEAPQDCGCIVFPDPIGERRSYREFTQTAGSSLLTRREIAVEPQPGRLVMFESWLPHAVQCNKSDKVRISIAINLRQAAKPRMPAAIGDAGSGAREQSSAESSADASATSKPFLFNEVFDVHPNLTITRTPIADAIPALVIDDVLRFPERARELVGRAPAANWKHEEGGRNFVDYYDCRLRFPIRYPNKLVALAQQAIRKVYSLDTRPIDASVDVNWFMQIRERRADFAVPHSDMSEGVNRSFTCVLYLNRPDECSGGTAFFRFKESSSLVLDEGYARAVHENPGLAETGLDYWPELAQEAWERVGVIDMAPGRLLVFPSEYFHAAYHPEDSFYDWPRLTLAFWMVC